MKRSHINRLLRRAEEFLAERRFHLPPFARWSPADWTARAEGARHIVDCGLGWDITDFGSGDFERCGLLLFTIRNGSLSPAAPGPRKTYAEKILIVEEGQVTPLHFHWSKMEDIIHRGGSGRLMVQLFNASADEQPERTSAVTAWIDGMPRSLPAGSVVALEPGESITLPQYCYHAFWADGGRLLLGEVSQVNDDSADNRFAEAAGRFPLIEEDELPLYLLCSDYAKHLKPSGS